MKKISILLIVISLFLGINSVEAASISNAEYKDNKITLSGTGIDQVQIVLFDLDNKPLYMTTASINDGKFNITLPEIKSLVNGKYTVKVADYDGKNTVKEEITVILDNPNTRDGIINSLIIGIVCIVGMVGAITYLKKNKAKKA